MRIRISATLMLAGFCAVAQAAGTGAWTLTRAEWSGVTDGAQVVAIAPLRAAVNALDKHRDARLVVLHNGGEDGLFWASDLEGWLVSLGVPSSRIDDRIGAIKPGRIRLQLAPPPGR